MEGLHFLHSFLTWLPLFVLQIERQEMTGGSAILNTINWCASHLTRRKKLLLQTVQMGFSAQDVKLPII